MRLAHVGDEPLPASVQPSPLDVEDHVIAHSKIVPRRAPADRTVRAACPAQAARLPHMRLTILRGGHAASSAPCDADGPTAAHTTRPGRADAAGAEEGSVPALGDGGQWVLVNISAAVAHQLDHGVLPASVAGLAEAKVRAVVLTDARLEHVGGLLALRGGAPIDLYATPAVFEELSSNLPVLPALQHYCGVHWRVIPVAGDQPCASFRVEGLPALEFTAVATQAPPLPHVQPHRSVVGDQIALIVRDLASGCQVFCAPGLVDPGPQELAWMQASDCVLLGHAPLPAGRAGAALEWVSALPARLKVMLTAADRPRRQQLARHGIAVASDGMEIDL